MKLTKILALIALVAVAAGFSACNSDEPEGGDEYGGVIFGDFVTLNSVDADGATMSLIPLGATKTVNLSTTYKFNTSKFRPDTRIFLNYYYVDGIQDNTISGPVNVIAALNVDGSGAEAPSATAEETDNYASHRINMSYLELSGSYVNFIYTGQSNGDPKSRHFYMDPATAESEYPEFHIMFEGNLSGETESFGIRGSYSLADVQAHAQAKGIKVIYPSTANRLEEKVLEFDRKALTPNN